MKKIKFEFDKVYHLYSIANTNFEKIYLNESHYIAFLKRIRAYFEGYLDVYAYCLMPNHFHFIVGVNPMIIEIILSGELNGTDDLIIPNEAEINEAIIQKLSNCLNSYAKWFNRRTNRRGTLFQRSYKLKEITDIRYLETCVHYIHKNPVRANLVIHEYEWLFSSFSDYANLRDDNFVDKSKFNNLTPKNVINQVGKELYLAKIIDYFI